MIAEPCCMQKVVKAVMEAQNRILTFHTYGDVSLEGMYKGIANLIAGPHVAVITMTELDISTADYLRHCFARGWFTDLVLTTSKNCKALVESTLSEYIEHVSYTYTEHVTNASGQMVLYSSPAESSEIPRQLLILNGEILNSKSKKGYLLTYTLLFQAKIPNYVSGEHGDHLKNALGVLSSIHKTDKKGVHGKTMSLRLFYNHEYLLREEEMSR